jgi:hypothetical protein
MSKIPVVPAFVPANVPIALPEYEPRITTPATAGNRSRSRSPSYLSGGPEGWRFQMRLPLSLSACQVQKNRKSFLKKYLGPGSSRSAQAKARMLAFVVKSICECVEFSMRGSNGVQGDGQFNDSGDLLSAVVAACQAGISRALTEPRYALEFAASLQSTLTTLTSVGGSGEGSGCESFA